MIRDGLTLVTRELTQGEKMDDVNSGMTEVLDSDADNTAIPITDMDEETLNAFLDAEKDSSQHPVQGGETKEPSDIKNSAANTQEPEPNKTDGSEAVVTRAEFEALMKRLNSQEKRVEGQELLIHRRTSELGEIKKELKELDRTLTQRYAEALEESPGEAYDIRDNIKETRNRIQAVEEEERSLQRRAQAQEIVSAHIPNEDFDIESMAETLSGDGIPQQYIDAFRRDPIGFLDGDYNPGLTLIHVARRAKAEKVLKTLYPITQKLAARVKELESNSGNVLKKVQEVARQTPQITASGARPSKQSKSSSIDISQIPNLSNEELEEFLANEK